MTRRSHFPAIVTWLVLFFFYVPIILLVVNSFNLSTAGTSWKGFTLQWYTRLFTSDEGAAIWRSLYITVVVGGLATLGSTILGTCAAFALHRYKTTLPNVHYSLIYTPLVLPEILIGISLLIFFASIHLPLGMTSIVLAHITFCVSYVTLAVLSRLQDFDMSVLEAARDLGASNWTTTWKVLVPIILPGILAGALLAFTLSIDDFVITFLVNGPGATTLPIQIQGMIKRGRSMPLINSISSILLAITFLALLGSKLLMKKSAKENL